MNEENLVEGYLKTHKAKEPTQKPGTRLQVRWAETLSEERDIIGMALGSISGHLDKLKSENLLTEDNLKQLSSVARMLKRSMEVRRIRGSLFKKEVDIEKRLRVLRKLLVQGVKIQGDKPYDVEKLELDAQRLARKGLEQLRVFFGQMPTELMEDKTLGASSKLVFCYLQSRAPEKKWEEHPSVKLSLQEISKGVGLHASSIIRLINELEEGGWVTTVRRGKMIVNKYILWPHGKPKKELMTAMARVHLRLQRDYALAKRLQESLHPIKTE